jgi:tetratricopeptide (TPR) repeat protein
MLRKFLLFFFLFCFGPLPYLCAIEPSELAVNHYQTGLAYERLGRIEESYTELQLAANLDANNPQMALALGIVATRLGRYDVALRSLEHSEALEANSCASYYELGLLYEEKKMDERAVESWQRFLQLNQDPELRAVAQKHIDHLEGRR